MAFAGVNLLPVTFAGILTGVALPLKGAPEELTAVLLGANLRSFEMLELLLESTFFLPQHEQHRCYHHHPLPIPTFGHALHLYPLSYHQE
jgi:hypothetical protein